MTIFRQRLSDEIGEEQVLVHGANRIIRVSQNRNKILENRDAVQCTEKYAEMH